MTRTSTMAILVAAGLVAAPAAALADCHGPLAEGTVAADHGAPMDEAEQERAALDAENLDAPEDSAILPSAEGHEESEAPTMEIDCVEHPELCAGEPLQQASEGPPLSEGGDPTAAAPGEPVGAGDPVIAEADC